MTRRAEGDDDRPDPSPSPVMEAADAYRARFGPQALPHETVQNLGDRGAFHSTWREADAT
jgi:hypothetical protein